jgi:dTDP-4-amino-4,6-dideoxygalactose transaminase
MAIPLFDCRLHADAAAAIAPVLASGQLAAGDHVAGLEADLSARLGGRPVVALSDMTHAMILALRVSSIGPGDEVLTLSYNCLSSNSAIRSVGATAVWVDIDPDTASMDVDDARSRITPATRAIAVYHAAGYPADMAALRQLCDENGLILIEDANNALGAQLPDGRQAGSAGNFSVFSFYANRQVNAIEGGALVCPDEVAAAKVRQLRRFGIDQAKLRDQRGEIDPRADVVDIGYSATLSNVNAALARHNLRALDARLAVVRANANAMRTALADVDGVKPVPAIGDAVPAYWGWLLLCDHRDELLDALRAAGIGCSKLHQPNHVYSGFGNREAALPGTSYFIDHVVAVPCGWWVGAPERQAIVETIAGALRR